MPQARSTKNLWTNQAPFQLFFLVAALEAVVGAASWLPLDFNLETASRVSAAEWHRNAFLFGMVPAILAGFLLTALPRWTRQPAVTRPTVNLLAGLWLFGRVASWASPTIGLVASAAFILWLTLIAAACMTAGRDRRNVTVLLLLLCFSASAVLTAGAWSTDFAIRTAVASIVGLMAIIGGRVVPALTESYVHSTGDQLLMVRSRSLDTIAGAATAGALTAWVASPQAGLTGLLCGIAALGQFLRLAQWHGWRVSGNPSIAALHIGYGWIVVGFALIAAHALAPEHIEQTAAVHAWTTGAIGTLALAIMSSMIRKHARRAFASSKAATAAFVAVTLSALSRLMAETSPSTAETWIVASAGLWVVAFGLFLVAWRRELWPTIGLKRP